MQRADDLFGMPNESPITDQIIEASIQWAEQIMQRIDSFHSKRRNVRRSWLVLLLVSWRILGLEVVAHAHETFRQDNAILFQ